MKASTKDYLQASLLVTGFSIFSWFLNGGRWGLNKTMYESWITETDHTATIVGTLIMFLFTQGIVALSIYHRHKKAKFHPKETSEENPVNIENLTMIFSQFSYNDNINSCYLNQEVAEVLAKEKILREYTKDGMTFYQKTRKFDKFYKLFLKEIAHH